jgi:hypothetical protein
MSRDELFFFLCELKNIELFSPGVSFRRLPMVNSPQTRLKYVHRKHLVYYKWRAIFTQLLVFTRILGSGCFVMLKGLSREIDLAFDDMYGKF